MQFTIPAPTTYTKVDDGVYKGSDGNFYEDETILRYRVMRKHTVKPYSDGGWGLYTSHDNIDTATSCMSDYKKESGHLYNYKLVDAGETLVSKRLIY
jgi:hypothetical protein